MKCYAVISVSKLDEAERQSILQIAVVEDNFYTRDGAETMAKHHQEGVDPDVEQFQVISYSV